MQLVRNTPSNVRDSILGLFHLHLLAFSFSTLGSLGALALELDVVGNGLADYQK
jgi:hypothetical protein